MLFWMLVLFHGANLGIVGVAVGDTETLQPRSGAMPSVGLQCCGQRIDVTFRYVSESASSTCPSMVLMYAIAGSGAMQCLLPTFASW